MTSKNKKIILDAKIRSQLNLTLPLVINQNMRTQKRACTMLMKINKWTYNGPTFKVKSEVICKKLGVLKPEHELININAKFIHKIMTNQSCKSIQENIVRPNRSTSIFYHKRPKKKLYRTALEHHVELYNQIPTDIKYLKPKTFSAKLKKRTIDYKPKD